MQRYIVKMANSAAPRRFTAVFIMARSVDEACAKALAEAPAYNIAQAKVA